MALIGQPKNVIKNGLEELAITFEELPFDLQFVADKCGIDTATELLKKLQGTNIYIPKMSHLTNYISRYIKHNRSKKNKELANELGVSENFIRRLKYNIDFR
ncbi:MAG: hypothetical protein FWG85_05625 [Bacteroidetes bacterium]|nr:hypothetical protein [Bacteroidota bacterium]